MPSAVHSGQYSVMCPRDCSVRDFRINSHRRPLVRPGDVHACGIEIRRPQTHPHTHPFNGPFSRTTQVSRYQKGKPIWILLKQETVSNSGISWAICKSAPCTRQITTPAPHHSVFYRPDALPAAQPTASKHRRRQTTISVHNYIRGVCVCVCVHCADRRESESDVLSALYQRVSTAFHERQRHHVHRVHAAVSSRRRRLQRGADRQPLQCLFRCRLSR